jgi:outer membrane protein assembly factor BamB
LQLKTAYSPFFDSRTTRPTRSVKLDTRVTTAPLNVVSASGARLLIGTERGLIALQTSDLSPVWRIATEGEPPTGLLAKADLDRDGGDEVVMITTRGRAAAVDIERGVIKWVAEGATDAMGAAFADVDNDGVLDVIVGARNTFAVGFSGRDGKLVWSTEEGARAASPNAPQGNSSERAPAAVGRKLIIADLPITNGAGNSLLLIGADQHYTILRAIRLTATPRRDAGNN